MFIVKAIIKISVLFTLSFNLFSCATPASDLTFRKQAELHESKAAIYLYRTNVYAVKDAYPFVFVNDEPQGKLEHMTYKVWEFEPGEYEWQIRAGDLWDEITALKGWEIREKKIKLSVEAGKHYFLRLKPSVQANKLGWRDAKLEQVNEANALKEIQSSTLSH